MYFLFFINYYISMSFTLALTNKQGENQQVFFLTYCIIVEPHIECNNRCLKFRMYPFTICTNRYPFLIILYILH